MAQTNGAGGPEIQLLLLGDGVTDPNFLRDLLRRVGNDELHLDLVQAAEEACTRLRQSQYDLLLVDGKPGDDSALQLLRSLPRTTPVLFLQGNPDDSSSKAIVQSVFCERMQGCDPACQCLAIAVLSAIDSYRREKQRQISDEMLRKLHRIVEQSPDPVMITDRSCVLEYVNPAFEALTGYARDEVIGQTLGILKSEQQAGELYEEMWDTVLSGNTFHGTVMNRKKNGETFILEKSITPLRNAAGEITHYISTGRDITDQRRLESQLQQAQKMDAVGRLAGGVAHDFNNLLMVISAYAELTLESLPVEHPSRAKVDEIINASRRAAELTKQLLAFGRKQLQSLQLLDLNSVLAQIGRMLPRLIGEDIQLLFMPGQNLDKVRADPVQIEQVVMNLAANARDAMPGGGKLTIETGNVHLDETYLQRHTIVPPGDYVLLTVTDSGIGIPQEHLAHIFEPFYTTKEEGKGTGLGLATVYGIVKQNGGFIWVYSEAGLGTTFKIYLPTAQSVIAEVASAAGPQDSPHGCETLLLVEDEAAVRESTRDFLMQRGYTVLEAANGEDALHVSREYCGPIDLMISDVVMPKMSGPNLADLLLAERPHMKVLFVSGYAENTVLRHGKIDVTARLLQKPFGLKTLARKIREVLCGNESVAKAATASP
ncbi:MAG TPA: ATP-binding protein [Terriglobales bacterium]|nr:ATP-binding protein [Terriglobales bacterium]